ncbi:hypothetical protein [Rhizobium sp. 18065]|uniref:hypothetical protein n=1 Tax=Rhizobium sp. 18065 TaxID=2681411 RepID=UPI00135A2586|nr:hypothetical protein [Rhizobium sp. 18065]
MTDQRELFESAVISRLKESGFLEIEIRTESLTRCGDGYQDEVINAGWHYWNTALAATPAPSSHVAGIITPQEIRQTAAWECIEEELRDELRRAADALEASEKEAGRLRKLVERRDEFIIGKSLWDDFKGANHEAE